MKKTVLYIVIVMTLYITGFTACSHLSKLHHGGASNHYDGEHFHNLAIDPKGQRSAKDFLTWFFNRNLEPWTNLTNKTNTLLNIRPTSLNVTWINHATVLVQVDGVNILTDPIWSERASPFSWLGPQRQVPPPIPISELPPIDAVVISHNHYDHMDLASLEQLNSLYQPVFITPLANKHYLESAGITNIIELDWWQAHSINSVKITATPAQHWSKRTLFDANRALWSGFYIQGLQQSVFYAGDTAYQAHFKLVKERLGPPSVALLPIGAYKPQWFMQRAHTSPEEAVLAHIDLKANISVPIHYGTFKLGDDSPESALSDLEKAIVTHHLDNKAFSILAPGELLSVKP